MSASFISEWIIRSVLLGAAAWLALVAIHGRRWARVRGVVATLALVALGSLLPASLFQLPQIAITVPEDLVSTMEQAGGGNSAAWLAAVWFAGVLLMLSREVFGVIRLRGLIAKASPLRELDWQASLESAKSAVGLTADIDLRASASVGPCAAGWLRPVILLPLSATQWSEEMRRQVLTHELAHFQRRDLWTQAFVRLVGVLHWFNPFVPALRRYVETGREMACDRMVLRCGGDPVRYAECLLELAGQPCTENTAMLAMSLPRRQSQLELRIRELLSGDGQRGRTLEIVLIAFAVALLVGCTFLRPATSATEWTGAEVERRLAADPFPGG